MPKGRTGRQHRTPPGSTGGVNQMNAMMTPGDAAKYLRLEISTLKARRRKGTGPKFYRYSSRCIRYRREDLDAWIELQAADDQEVNDGE